MSFVIGRSRVELSIDLVPQFRSWICKTMGQSQLDTVNDRRETVTK